ncbi:MAG: glycosyltransferase family 2 protein [Lacibacter sp.]
MRNAVLNDFPVTEAISSILPVVDEMIISIDKGDDDTEGLIRSIVSDKIRIVYSTWDMNLRKGGQVYAIETNKAMQHISADTDWIFYIQADEVIHEKYHTVIRETAERYRTEKKVDGLLFKYLHFYGTYEYVGDSRKWYRHEVRLVKNDHSITSYKDAQGFRRGNEKIRVVPVDAEVYHYGWVKSPQQMRKKQNITRRFYFESDVNQQVINKTDSFDFSEFDSLKKFTGTHPLVMQKRIASKNWQVELDINRKKFTLKNKILFWIEKKTGKRPFEFRNYRKIKL